jgi:KDO2-lipid IV(A) lauroyltransferase
MDVAGMATQLFQKRAAGHHLPGAEQPGVRPRHPPRPAALRPGRGVLAPRQALPLVRAIKRGFIFFNLPDMDFGLRDAAFVPFFGVPAATLLAPSRMARSLNMVVQPVVAEILPGGQGYRVRFGRPGPTGRPTTPRPTRGA